MFNVGDTLRVGFIFAHLSRGEHNCEGEFIAA